jgi:hypothetical protein
MKKIKLIRIDYSMLSSYMGRSATVVVFAVIIMLALGALFLEENDMAHMPITVGVCALDSMRSWGALGSLADLVREKGAGVISWRYLDTGTPPADCDFYLMTSIQGAPYISEGSLKCVLIAMVRPGIRYTRGVVVGRKGAGLDALQGGRVIFTSPISATGFVSPYRAIVSAGFTPDDSIQYEFAGSSMGEEAVAFGVLYGAYDAGGIGLERLELLQQRGIVPVGQLDVLLEGPPLPEIIIAAEPSVDSRVVRGFCERVPLILEKMSPFLMADLSEIGVAGFIKPREEDLRLLETLSTRKDQFHAHPPNR